MKSQNTRFDYNSRYCESNAGYFGLAPVQANEIVFEAYSRKLYTLLLSPSVRNVLHVSPEDHESSRYARFIDEDAIFLNRVNCVYKGLAHDESSSEPSEYLADVLIEKNVCLQKFIFQDMPLFRLKRFDNLEEGERGLWSNHWDDEKSLDFGYRIIEEKTGAVHSEYRNISTPQGPFMHFMEMISFRGFGRYSCSPEITDIFSHNSYHDAHLEQFLSVALRPENSIEQSK